MLLGVSILVFSLMHLIPGNAAQMMAGEGASPQTIAALEEKLGLNDPLPVQYGRYMSHVLQGDLGDSIRNGRPVIEEIKNRFWVTAELAIYATIVAVFLGLIAGIISAVRHSTLSDAAIMMVALFGLSMPNFWLGLVLIQWFAVGGDFLPDFLKMRPSGWGDSWRQVVLPVITSKAHCTPS